MEFVKGSMVERVLTNSGIGSQIIHRSGFRFCWFRVNVFQRRVYSCKNLVPSSRALQPVACKSIFLSILHNSGSSIHLIYHISPNPKPETLGP